nr:hypothetical protein StreXyl84_36380 [Streptomyces sp. Xyl84]
MRIRGRGLRFTAVLAVVVLALTGFSRGHGHGGHGSGGSGGCSSSRQDHDTSSSSSSGGGTYGSGTDGTYAPEDDDTYGSGGSGTGTTGGSSSHRRRPDLGPTATPSGGGTETRLQDARVRLLSCATEKKPYATVELTNPNDRRGTFTATVTFQDAHGGTIRSALRETDVPANGRRTVRVDAGAPGDGVRPAHCTVDPAAPAAG